MEILISVFGFWIYLLVTIISSRWPLFGKILWFLTFSVFIGFIWLIAVAIFSDSDYTSAIYITILICLILEWAQFRSQFWEYFRKKNITIATQEILPPLEIKELSLNEKIGFIDIGIKSSVILIFSDRSQIKIQLKNLAKIVYEIIRDFWKNEFAPGELSRHFIYLKDNYKTSLPPSEYSQLMTILERFVREGWRAEVI